MDTLVLYFSFI